MRNTWESCWPFLGINSNRLFEFYRRCLRRFLKRSVRYVILKRLDKQVYRLSASLERNLHRQLWLCPHLVPGSGVCVGYILLTVMWTHRFYKYPMQNSGTMPVPKYNNVKNLYSSSEVGTVADSLYVLVFASSETIHFFSQPLLTAKFAF